MEPNEDNLSGISLLAQQPGSLGDAVLVQLEGTLERCRTAVDDARRNLRSAQAVLADAEKAVEQAVMAEAFLRCLATRDRSDEA